MDSHLDYLIEKILEMLEPTLKKDKDGRYQTTYGVKTREGLKATIRSILLEE